MIRWYQTVFIKGVDAVFEDINRCKSKFWNEGKWNNFVKPLLSDIDRGSFLDIGCSAGLHLKMAKDEEFKNVFGIEGSRRIMKQAELYKKSVSGDYTLLRWSVNNTFSLEQLPLFDVILLANMHYYLPISDFMRLVDQMRSRTVYCIVVSCLTRKFGGCACSDLGAVRRYFHDWGEIKLADGIPQEGDPSPRPRMYGVMFKSALKKKPIENILTYWREESMKPKDTLTPAYEEFYRKVFSRKPFNFKNTLLYQWLKTERPGQIPEETMAQKKALAEDIQKNGLKNPIFIDHHGTLIDGLSRLFIMKELGYKNIFVRVV